MDAKKPIQRKANKTSCQYGHGCQETMHAKEATVLAVVSLKIII